MDDWNKYQLLVLHELTRLNENILELTEKTSEIDKELSVLRVRASLFGSISATITVVFALIIEWFLKRSN
jgi:hypothetical protein